MRTELLSRGLSARERVVQPYDAYPNALTCELHSAVLHTPYANLSRSHYLTCNGEAAMYVLTEYSYVREPYVPSTALLDPSLGHNAESTKKWKRKQRN